MEYLSGGDLFSYFNRNGVLEEDEAKFYIAECIVALEYLHARCIIHRGI
jgi:serine/threonine protein kinase